MTMRERMLAFLRGEASDRVPFVQYSNIAAPNEEIWEELGRDRMGILRWTSVHRVDHPNCEFEHEDIEIDGQRRRRTTLHTPAGDLWEERIFEEGYGSSSISRHFVQDPVDYDILNAHLRDGIVIDHYDGYRQVEAELGDDGLPLPAVERTPYQQLWVQWAGIANLSMHLLDCPDRVAETVDLLTLRARQIFELAARSPAPFIDFPDNITAPTIGLERFRRYCVPLYRELAALMGERPVFVHMDGDLRPLWNAIGESGVGGIDSLSPPPDNDTSVADSRRMWPDMRLGVNFPSSVHLKTYDAVRAVATQLIEEDGRSGRLQIQVSENVPHGCWHTSYAAIADAIDACF
jgi:hypothetical protein